MYYGVFHCFMGCHEWFKTWVCFMGCCIVSGGVVLFHGVLYCFMGCSTVSWGAVLFHGVLYCFMGCHEWFKTWVCFMGCCIFSLGVVLFQSTDVPGQQLWGRGSGHGTGGRGPAAAGAGHQGAPVLHRQPGARQVGSVSSRNKPSF